MSLRENILKGGFAKKKNTFILCSNIHLLLREGLDSKRTVNQCVYLFLNVSLLNILCFSA